MKVLNSLLVAAALALTASANATTNEYVELAFEQAPDTQLVVSNYFIAYGANSRGTNNTLVMYEKHQMVTKSNAVTITCSVSNLNYGRFYFTAYAMMSNGVISALSNEVGWTNKTFGPQNLRISGPRDALALESSLDLKEWKTLAVIVSGSQPLVLSAKPQEMFRAVSTSLPPLPFTP